MLHSHTCRFGARNCRIERTCVDCLSGVFYKTFWTLGIKCSFYFWIIQWRICIGIVLNWQVGFGRIDGDYTNPQVFNFFLYARSCLYLFVYYFKLLLWRFFIFLIHLFSEILFSFWATVNGSVSNVLFLFVLVADI